MAIGFVVARFGLFLELLSVQRQAAYVQGQSGRSAILGVLFVIVGAMAILLAAVQHRRFISTLPAPDLPRSYNPTFAIALSSLVGVLGLVLAAYLVVSHP